MNLAGLASAVLLCLVFRIHAAPSPCDESSVEDPVCTETEYESYRMCIEESRARRQKRATGSCPPALMPPIMHVMKPVEVLVPVSPRPVLPVPPQPVVPVFPQPVAPPMLKNLGRTVIVGPDPLDDEDDYENSVHYRVPVNVTTVIRLTNLVNNTNHIHVPTTLNNTNVNNIHVYTNLTDGDPASERCCTAVRPKSCHTTTEGVRCKHRKFRSCGPQCTSDVIHVQTRKRCNRATGVCEEKIAYVPQPGKPTCVYIDEWPFVVCGKVADMNVICSGCYDHYGYGYEAFNGRRSMQPQCRGCYDDAFDEGPRYRRGPVFRPFYYHQAPCFLTNSCPDKYQDCGFGCYGHDRIDPVWGEPDMDSFPPAGDQSDPIFFEPEGMPISIDQSDDWGVPSNKCAIVTDGDTITVKNCTDGNDNPFMAAPAKHPYYKQLQFDGKPARDKGNTTAPVPEKETPAETPEDQNSSGDGDDFYTEENGEEDDYDT